MNYIDKIVSKLENLEETIMRFHRISEENEIIDSLIANNSICLIEKVIVFQGTIPYRLEIRKHLLQVASEIVLRNNSKRRFFSNEYNEAFASFLLLSDKGQISKEVNQTFFQGYDDLDIFRKGVLATILQIRKLKSKYDFFIHNFDVKLLGLVEHLFQNGSHSAIDFFINSEDFELDSTCIFSENEYLDGNIFEEMLKYYLQLLVFDHSLSQSKTERVSKIVYAVIKMVDFKVYELTLHKILDEVNNAAQEYDEVNFLQSLDIIYGRLCIHGFLNKAEVLKRIFELKDNDATYAKKIQVEQDFDKSLTLYEQAKKSKNVGIYVWMSLAFKFNTLKEYSEFYYRETSTQLIISDFHVFKSFLNRIRNYNDYELFLKLIDFSAILSQSNNPGKSLERLDGLLHILTKNVTENKKSLIGFSVLMVILPHNIIFESALQLLFMTRRRISQQDIYLENVRKSHLERRDLTKVVSYYVANRDYKTCLRFMDEFEITEDPKLYESLIHKAFSVKTALAHFREAKSNGLHLSVKCLYTLMNKAKTFSQNGEIYKDLKKYHGQLIDEKVFANYVVSIGPAHFNRNFPTIYQRIKQHDIDLKLVILHAINKTTSFGKIRKYILKYEELGYPVYPAHFTNAIKKVSSFKDACKFFWYYANKYVLTKEIDKLDERMVIALINRTNTASQTHKLLFLIANKFKLYLNDRFLLAAARKCVNFNQIRKLERNFLNENEHNLEFHINYELIKRRKYEYFIEAHGFSYLQEINSIKIKCNYLNLLLEKAHGAQQVSDIVKQFELHKLSPDTYTKNILLRKGITRIEGHQDFSKKLTYTKNNEDTILLKLKLAGNQNKKKLDQIFGEYRRYLNGEVLDHRIVFEYFRKHDKPVNTCHFAFIKKTSLNCEAYYLAQYLMKKQPSFLKHIQTQKNGRKDEASLYWKNLVKGLLSRNKIELGEFVTLQCIGFKKDRVTDFLVWGTGLIASVPRSTVDKEFYNLQIGDFVCAKLIQKTPSIELDFEDLPFVNIESI